MRPQVLSEARDYILQTIKKDQFAEDGGREEWKEGEASQNGFLFAPVSLSTFILLFGTVY